MEGDAAGVKRTRNILIFQSTPSVWRETVIWEMQRKRRKYFNPLPPCGGRHVIAPNSHLVQYFNPRPPCGGRRHGSQGRDGRLYTFQSTPSVWRETGHGQQDCRPYPISIHSLRVEGDRRILTMQEEGAISIHSLRVEGDKYRLTVSGGGKISIHSLRVEGDASAQQQRCTRALFQSTPSVWRETNILQLAITHIVFQSTPSVWRETPLTRIGFRVCVFQSTPSVWRETY